MRKSLFISVLSLILTAALAYGQNSINVGSVTGDPGADVTVNITVTSDKNVAGASFTVVFDQTKLQITTAVGGADAAAMTPVGVDVAAANSDGSLEVSLVDFSFSSPVAAGTDKQLYVVTFTIDAAASGEIPVELDGVSLSDESAGDIAVAIVNGAVTVAGAGPEPSANAFWVTDAEGEAGSDVTVKVLTTTDKNVAGASFTVNFDQTKLQISTTAGGADAAAMTPVGVDIAAANSDGSLEVSLVDFSFSSPIAAGENKEVYVITLTIAAGTAAGDLALSLTDVSLSDESAAEIVVELTDGTVTVTGGGPGPVTPPEPPTDQNVVWALPVEGAAGETATVIIGINTLSEIAGVSFIFEFDQTLIKLTEAKVAGVAAAMAPVGVDAAAANADGSLEVSLVDFSFSNPIALGQGDIMEISIEFLAAGTATFQLASISMSDPGAVDVPFVQWTPEEPTAIGDEALAAAVLPRAFSLSQSAPNPFNPSTTISFDIRGDGAAAAHVSLKVYNVRGKMVKTLVDEFKPAGRYSIQWNGRSDNGALMASGVYFYRLKTRDFEQTRKMVLLK